MLRSVRVDKSKTSREKWPESDELKNQLKKPASLESVPPNLIVPIGHAIRKKESKKVVHLLRPAKVRNQLFESLKRT